MKKDNRKKHSDKRVKVMARLLGEKESGAALIGDVIRVVLGVGGGRRWAACSARF